MALLLGIVFVLIYCVGLCRSALTQQSLYVVLLGQALRRLLWRKPFWQTRLDYSRGPVQ